MGHDKISVGKRTLGAGHTYVIAEIGSNHATSLETALESIDAAADCGADAVKFQSLNVSEQYHTPPEEIIRLHEKIDLDESWYGKLRERCDYKNVDFISSPTYPRSVELLEAAGVKAFKIASAQVGTFSSLVRQVARTGKPVFFSTGIVDLAGIGAVVRIFEEENNPNYVILHCSSIYPLPYERVNLQQIRKYRDFFGCLVGYSDHTEGPFISAAAVALGAVVIEKHFTLSKNMDSPDASLSMEPAEFQMLVSGIRAVDQAMKQASRHRIEPEEASFKKRIEEKLILAKGIRAGEFFESSDFLLKRASSGVNADALPVILENLVAKRDIPAGTLLEWSDLNGIIK